MIETKRNTDVRRPTFTAANGTVWVQMTADLFALPGCMDPGKWRTEPEVVEMDGELSAVKW